MSFVLGSRSGRSRLFGQHKHKHKPSPLLAHTCINTSLLCPVPSLLRIDKHFCNKIIRCFYEKKLHIYILNELQCVFVWTKKISYAPMTVQQFELGTISLSGHIHGERIFCQLSRSAAGKLSHKFSPLLSSEGTVSSEQRARLIPPRQELSQLII